MIPSARPFNYVADLPRLAGISFPIPRIKYPLGKLSARGELLN